MAWHGEWGAKYDLENYTFIIFVGLCHCEVDGKKHTSQSLHTVTTTEAHYRHSENHIKWSSTKLKRSPKITPVKEKHISLMLALDWRVGTRHRIGAHFHFMYFLQIPVSPVLWKSRKENFLRRQWLQDVKYVEAW